MDNQIAIPLGANEENFPNLAPLNNPPTMIDCERAQVYLDCIVKVLSLRAIDYEAVPFPDGSMPGDPEYDLPPLTNAEAIRGLSARQVRDYFDLYHLAGVGLGVPRKRVAIARH
ncbi:hypothetical protein FRB93_010875, partial [Tulasnella sp. JGI-2019a]